MSTQKMRKLLVLLLVFVVAVVTGLVSGCKTETATAAAAETTTAAAETTVTAKKFKIGIAMQYLGSPYFVAMADYLKEYATEKGFEVIGVLDSQRDVTKEANNIESLISLDADFIISNPADAVGSVAILEEVYKEGIPVICVDNSPPEGTHIVTSITSDNVNNGVEVGKWVGENYFKDKTIYSIMLSIVKSCNVCYERRTGLIDGIIQARTGWDAQTSWDSAVKLEQELIDKGKAYHKEADFYILGQGWGEGQEQKGLTEAEDLLVANNNVNLILGESDAMLLGAMTAVKNQGLTDQVILAAAADGQKEAYAMIKAGSPYVATGLNSPTLVAKQAIDLAWEILTQGKDPYSYDKIQYTPPACINPTNVDKYYDPDAIF